jgi:hypothetical protein
MKKTFFCLGLIIMLFTSCNEDGSPSGVTFFIIPKCGSQLTDISQSIFCRQLPREIPVYRYRFIVKDPVTSNLVGIIDTPKNSFNMVNLGLNNLALGKTYKIEVQVALDASLNFTTVINPPCTLRTPDLPEKSSIIIPQCGSIVNTLWTNIFAKQTLGAEKYRFVVVDGSQTRIIETTESSFQLADLPGGAAANTQYFIRVDILYKGTWYQSDQLCSITTSPTATLRQSTILQQLFINK